jgi:hypothetical protein
MSRYSVVTLLAAAALALASAASVPSSSKNAASRFTRNQLQGTFRRFKSLSRTRRPARELTAISLSMRRASSRAVARARTTVAPKKKAAAAEGSGLYDQCAGDADMNQILAGADCLDCAIPGKVCPSTCCAMPSVAKGGGVTQSVVCEVGKWYAWLSAALASDARDVLRPSCQAAYPHDFPPPRVT